MSWQARLQAIQLSLLDDEFGLNDEERAFVHEYVSNGGNGTEAMTAVRPRLKRDSAERTARRWLRRPEVARYLDRRRAEAALRAELDVDEVIENARVIHAAGMGLVKLPKTIVVTTKEGDVIQRDVELADPSLPAANQANAQLAAMLVRNAELAQGRDASEREIDDLERAARVASILALRKRRALDGQGSEDDVSE